MTKDDGGIPMCLVADMMGMIANMFLQESDYLYWWH